jgi:mannose-6-phosphate isomerase-like protein (cupin superfamily)
MEHAFSELRRDQIARRDRKPNDGIEITTQDVRTRLIAWPGNGFQTESVHVLTLAAGEESARYDYDMADEAMVCFKGRARFTCGASGCRSSPATSPTFRNAFPTRSGIRGKTRAISCL